MSHFSLLVRLHLILIPLLLTGLVVGFITDRNVLRNRAELERAIRAAKVKEEALTTLSLLLPQDDASKQLLIDPENTTAAGRRFHGDVRRPSADGSGRVFHACIGFSIV